MREDRRGTVYTRDNRCLADVAREATARAESLQAALAETKRIAEWATRELARLREEHEAWAQSVRGRLNLNLETGR